jgi:phage baseplate assembly protein W
MPVDTPHFDLPFRFSKHAICAEQHSQDDVENCVEAIIRTEIGARETLVGFGIPDQTFTEIPLDMDIIRQQIYDWEPRAQVVLSEQLIDQLTDQITTEVATRGDPNFPTQ